MLLVLFPKIGHQTTVWYIEYFVSPQLNSIIEQKPSERINLQKEKGCPNFRGALSLKFPPQNVKCTANCRNLELPIVCGIWSTPEPARASLSADDDFKR